MQSFPVVEDFDVLEQSHVQLVSCGPVFAVGELALDRSPQTFRDRIIPTVSFPAHRTDHVIITEVFLVVMTGVLTATIGVVDKSWRRVPSGDGIVESGEAQLITHVGRGGPADHGPAVAVDDRR
jgi:hypothetical protein